MATEPRYCVNCKHYLKGRTFNCRRDVKVTYERSEIDGKTRKSEGGGYEARSERKYEGKQYCGPSAKFYEEKRLTRRVIAMFR